MKKSIVWITMIIFAFTSFGFSSPTPSTIKANTNNSIKLTIDSATLTENYFPQQLYHTSKTIAPSQFEFEKTDFATEQWHKLIQTVYVQQTDNNFILTTIAVNGAVIQQTILSNDELQSKIKAVSDNNASIKALAVSKTEPQYIDFFENVYKSNIYTVYSLEPASYAKLSGAKLEETYPDYLNKVSMAYTVYKKGSAFILMNWIYPSLNWESSVYMSLTDVEKALNSALASNQEMLATIFKENVPTPQVETPKVLPPVQPGKPPTKVVPPVKDNQKIIPVKTFYVLVILKNKTYLIQEFKTQSEASKFMATAIKKYGKAAVKTFDDKKDLENLIKKLKLIKAKIK